MGRTKPGPFPEKGPLSLQDHGNPIRFRNIWCRECRRGRHSLVTRIGDVFAGVLPPNEGEVQVLAGSEEECERWRAAIRDAFPRGTARGRGPSLPRR